MTGETPNPLEYLRELLRGEPMEPDADWNEACAEWIHEHGSQVEALAEAAQAAMNPITPSLSHWQALRAALVPFAVKGDT